MPPGSFRDEQSIECEGEIKVSQREKNTISDGQNRDPIFSFDFMTKKVETTIIMVHVWRILEEYIKVERLGETGILSRAYSYESK